jgi:hypothetical protein
MPRGSGGRYLRSLFVRASVLAGCFEIDRRTAAAHRVRATGTAWRLRHYAEILSSMVVNDYTSSAIVQMRIVRVSIHSNISTTTLAPE